MPTRILLASFDHAQDFLDRFKISQDGSRVISVSTKSTYDENEAVVLEISFPEIQNNVLLRGKYIGTKDGDRRFLLDLSQKDVGNFLITIASGCGEATWKRTHQRFPMAVGASIKTQGETPENIHAKTVNISTDGLQFSADERLPQGSQVTVIIKTAAAYPDVTLDGSIVWTDTGDDDKQPRMGVRFNNTFTQESKKLRQIVRKIKGVGTVNE